MKSVIKKFIPISLKLKIRALQYRIFGFEKNYKNMDNAEIFDKIYEDKVWGVSEDGYSTSGVGSHSDEVIKPYIQQVSRLLDDLRPSVIVDLGCGDFNVGRNFVQYTKEYIAGDVSDVILERNSRTFSKLKNVKFKHVNLCKLDLPNGDICFVRQVLQHLSNSDIMAFVSYINKYRPYKKLIITEHLPLKQNFKENLDKPSGAQSRLIYGSGVVLDKPPFSLMYSSKYDLVEVKSGGGIIKTTVYCY